MKKVLLFFTSLFLVQFALLANTTKSNDNYQVAIMAADDCADATDISNLLGGAIDMPMTSTLFTNVGATVSAFEEALPGYACFLENDGTSFTPSLENAQWVTFTGDGGLYSIVSTDCGATVTDYIDDGDTQFAIYRGVDCNNLTPVACNEDLNVSPVGPFPAGLDFQTEENVVYYMMIDGFAGSDGEYCLEFTQRSIFTCNEIALDTATITTSNVCFNDIVDIQLTNAVIPVLPNSAFVWGIFGSDISGSIDPFNEPDIVGFFPLNPDIYVPGIANDGTQLPAGTYFFTPITFGNGVDTIGDNLLSSFSFANGCIITGNSIEVNFLTELTSLTGIGEGINETAPGSNGEASVSVTGGSGAYTYVWNNGETTSSISNLVAGVYSVVVSDQTGCVDDISLEVMVDNTVSINELDFEKSIKLFPNPTNQLTAIQYGFSESVDLDITITNTIGQVVFQKVINNTLNGSTEINVSDFSNGVYFVQLSEGENQTSRRLIVTK